MKPIGVVAIIGAVCAVAFTAYGYVRFNQSAEGQQSQALQAKKIQSPFKPPAPFSETILAPYTKAGSGGFSPYWAAYIIAPKDGAKDKDSFIDLNGKRLGPYTNLSGLIELSGDGKHIAFAAEKAGQWIVVVDGVEKYSVKAMEWSWSAWSPDLEGNSFIPQTQAAMLQFSSDGKSLAYAGDLADGKKAVFVNGKPGPSFAGLGDSISFVDGQLTTLRFRKRRRSSRSKANTSWVPSTRAIVRRSQPMASTTVSGQLRAKNNRS